MKRRMTTPKLKNEQQLDIEQQYFDWLSGIALRDLRFVYGKLLTIFHEREFYWSIPYDDNREEDGKQLRAMFLDQHDINPEYHLSLRAPCTFLELLVGLATRMNDQLYRPVAPDRTNVWFITLLNNLELLEFTNDNFRAIPGGPRVVNEIIDRVLDRTYERSGKGGLFPLDTSAEDQRKIELWYQMMAYIEDNYVC